MRFGPATGRAAPRSVEIGGVGPNATDVDLVAWSDAVEWLALGPYRCHARAAWVRVSAAGVPQRLAACEAMDGIRSADGTPLVVQGAAAANGMQRASW